MKRVLTFIGTRPEIIKVSPIIPLLGERFRHILVHSGQHYSYEMDAIFFQELNLPTPDYTIAVGSAAHGEQTARMLSRLEPILQDESPAAIVVQGDTNTTLAGGLCAAKLGIPVVHLEAGCRSFNRTMPEELNRVVVDHLSNLLLAPDEDARTNLLNEGLPPDRIHITGSSVIDACLRSRTFATRSTILERLALTPGNYLALTMHRAENTAPDRLPGIVAALNELAQDYPIAFPIHPRTAAALAQQGLTLVPQIHVCDPLGYLDTLHLVENAQALLTDSGGLQEEAAALGTPAFILRNETEWRYLVESGVHLLIGNQYEGILTGVRSALTPERLRALRAIEAPVVPGASKRVVDLIADYLEKL